MRAFAILSIAALAVSLFAACSPRESSGTSGAAGTSTSPMPPASAASR